MRSRSKAVISFFAVLLIVALSGSAAQAAETVSSDTVVIRNGVIVEDDLYASGFQVLIEGVVRGDLIVLAGEELIIDGVVEGSVFALTQDVVVNGEVRGSVRTVAAGTRVNGSVGEDLVVIGVRADIDAGGTVGGDVLIWSWNSSLTGVIGGDLGGVQRNLDLAGAVGGEVDVSVRSLEIIDDLTVGGDLTYAAEHAGEGLDRVDSGGVIVQKTPLPSNVRVRALGLFAKLLTFILLTAVAMLIAMSWPGASEKAGERARRSPALAFAVGLAVLISPGVLALVALWILRVAPTAASLPLLAVMLPIIVALTTFVGLVAVAAGTPTVLLIGRLLRSRASLYGAVAVGSAFVGLLWLMPRVGVIVPLLALPIGVGSWILTIRSGAAHSESLDGTTV